MNKPWPSDFGRPRLVTITNPAAGANFTQTVETNSIWVVQSLKFVLTTDANVATRVINITLSTPTLLMLTLGHQFTQAASLGVTYNLCWNHPEVNASPGGQVNRYFPPRYFLNEGDIIASSITNIQATDAFTLIQLRVLEWLIEQV